jgi:hypothetical protein
MKKILAFLTIIELWWLIVGTIVHEWCHNLSFYVLSGGRFGDLHVFDAVSINAGTLGICYPPTGFMIQNTIYVEPIAYMVQIFVTILFGFLLYKYYYRTEEMEEIPC